MAEELGSSTLTGHGEKCTATMGAEVLPEPIGEAAFAPLVVLAVLLVAVLLVAVAVLSAGESSQASALDVVLLAWTDFASQLISMDSDGTMYPSTQMLHWSP